MVAESYTGTNPECGGFEFDIQHDDPLGGAGTPITSASTGMFKLSSTNPYSLEVQTNDNVNIGTHSLTIFVSHSDPIYSSNVKQKSFTIVFEDPCLDTVFVLDDPFWSSNIVEYTNMDP